MYGKGWTSVLDSILCVNAWDDLSNDTKPQPPAATAPPPPRGKKKDMQRGENGQVESEGRAPLPGADHSGEGRALSSEVTTATSRPPELLRRGMSSQVIRRRCREALRGHSPPPSGLDASLLSSSSRGLQVLPAWLPVRDRRGRRRCQRVERREVCWAWGCAVKGATKGGREALLGRSRRIGKWRVAASIGWRLWRVRTDRENKRQRNRRPREGKREEIREGKREEISLVFFHLPLLFSNNYILVLKIFILHILIPKVFISSH
jgi:hypothetical protein